MRLTIPLILWITFSLPALARPGLPTGIVPEGVGVNIHFTDPEPGEMEMLAQGGFGWVRMDFIWLGTEKERGKYDFSAYERLLKALEPHHIRALFILDYSNPLYDNDLSPYTEEGRQAFARWAAAAARHFAGKGILWEMYNEPNIGFWRPRPNPDDYIALALAVGKSIRRAAPGELYVGPATSGIDLGFLERCFKAGLLELWDAVTVHPYRGTPPETTIPDYAKLRALIARYAPKGKKIPILSGEWGYTDLQVSIPTQAKYLPRQWLVNLSQGVPLSIWYDWHDDGPNPKEGEHHFGTVFYPYHEGRRPVYDPKPAYIAAQTLVKVLRGFRFSKRLALATESEFCLLFTRGRRIVLAAWTARKEPDEITLPVGKGPVQLVHNDGSTTQTSAEASGLRVPLEDAPLYLLPRNPGPLLRLIAASGPLPHELRFRAGLKQTLAVTLSNPLSQRLAGTLSLDTAHRPGREITSVRWSLKPGETRPTLLSFPWVLRSPDPIPFRVLLKVDGFPQAIPQSMTGIVTNPLSITALPFIGRALEAILENPSAEPFAGWVMLESGSGSLRSLARLTLKAGQTSCRVRFDGEGEPGKEYRIGFRVIDRIRGTVLQVPAQIYLLQEDFARFPAGSSPQEFRLIPDGDPAVPSEMRLSIEKRRLATRSPEVYVARIDYRFADGWKFLRLTSTLPEALPLKGRPLAAGMWVYGDGTGNYLRCRFVDATGQTFQPDYPALTWKGWRYVTAPLDGTQAGYWGGAGDGRIHYPIRWDSPVLIDSKGGRKTEGTVLITGLTILR